MNFIEQLGAVIKEHGAASYLGEPVDMQAHFLQCAENVARAGGDDTVVAAALLHDIGHFARYFDLAADEGEVDRRHGELGQRILAPHFDEDVTEPIRLHVAAKRYLCATEATYFDRLSPASVASLALQGGPMDAAEADEFANNPWHQGAVMLRRADDDAKVPGATTRAFDDYVPLLQALIARSHESRDPVGG